MLVILASIGACTPWEGTWLFEVDRNVEYEDDCVPDEDDEAATTVYTGGDQRLVDMYPTSGGGIVVLWDQPLSGSTTASGIEVGWEATREDEEASVLSRIVLAGTLEAGVLTGTVADEQWQEFDGGGDYHCVASRTYTAQRIDASRNEHVE